MTKYEKLIEYVNNGEEGKAADLFHEIVVSKSRDIYESLMDSENEFGGDQADELINDISADEEGMREGEEDEAPDFGGDDELGGDEFAGGEEELGGNDEFGGAAEEEASIEDRVVDLEDSMDALMAEFNAEMGLGDELGGEEGLGDELGAEDELGMEPELGAEEEMGMEGRFNEAVSLTKVTKGISNSTESEGTNKKSVNADNSGKKGSAAKPHQTTGEDNGRPNPEVKPGDGTTEPNESKVKEPKKTGEDAGVNKKSLSGS